MAKPRVPAEHVADRSPSDDRDKAASKFRVIEMVMADPMLSSSDKLVAIAHLHYLQWPRRTAWMSNPEIAARTALDVRVVRESRSTLQGFKRVKVTDPVTGKSKSENVTREGARAYFTKTGEIKTPHGMIDVFEISDQWHLDMVDFIQIKKESITEKESERRQKYRLKNAERDVPASVDVTAFSSVTENECHSKNTRDVTAFSSVESSKQSSENILLEERQWTEGLKFNPYAAAKDGEGLPLPIETEERFEAFILNLAKTHSLTAQSLSNIRKDMASGALRTFEQLFPRLAQEKAA